VPVIKLKMKFFIAYAVVFGLLAFEEIQAEAKIEASAAATKPFAAEQNFNLLKQFGHEDESKLDQDYLGEGSGWGDNEDDDDYDDEEYYDEDDDDYYDDDDDDLDFGSGDDQLLHELPKATEEAKLIPDHQEDLHFAAEDQKKKNSDQVQDSDLLYEYYNELLFGEDEQDDLDYLDEVEQDLGTSSDDDQVKITSQTHPKENSEVKSWNLQPSYIFLMLTSALITFAIVVLAFILCRKSMISRQHKTKSMPFVISSVNSHNHHHQKSSPIVKNYQRVPTSTKELMQQQNQHQSQLAAEMGLSETQKPLL
jgi:CHASE3 domain sensor protein